MLDVPGLTMNAPGSPNALKKYDGRFWGDPGCRTGFRNKTLLGGNSDENIYIL